jgi:hypothetical protein
LCQEIESESAFALLESNVVAIGRWKGFSWGCEGKEGTSCSHRRAAGEEGRGPASHGSPRRIGQIFYCPKTQLQLSDSTIFGKIVEFRNKRNNLNFFLSCAKRMQAQFRKQ